MINYTAFRRLLLILNLLGFYSFGYGNGHEGEYVFCNSEADYNREAHRISIPNLKVLDQNNLSLGFFDQDNICKRVEDLETLRFVYEWFALKFTNPGYYITSYKYRDSTEDRPKITTLDPKILSQRVVIPDEPKKGSWRMRDMFDGSRYVTLKLPLKDKLFSSGLLKASEMETLQNNRSLRKTMVLRRWNYMGGIRLVYDLKLDDQGLLSVHMVSQ